jgi:hypothetical protein
MFGSDAIQIQSLHLATIEVPFRLLRRGDELGRSRRLGPYYSSYEGIPRGCTNTKVRILRYLEPWSWGHIHTFAPS